MVREHINQAPGFGADQAWSHRQILLNEGQYLPGLFVLDGANARDTLNSQDVRDLRAGLLLGRITASHKLAASVIGQLQSSVSSSGTSLDVGTAAATEIERRIGTGAGADLRLVGPPTAQGTVQTETAQVSSINKSGGTVTVNSGLTNGYIQGALVQPTDGSEDPKTIFLGAKGQGYPVAAVDADDNDRDIEVTRYLIGGLIDSDMILHWPSNAKLQGWIVAQLNEAGQFLFDHQHA